MRRALTFYPVSEMYGGDTDRDGVFESLFLPGSESGLGLKVCADDGSGERRCVVVFDLKGGNVGDWFQALQHLTVSVGLFLQAVSETGGGSYELHGFASGPTVTLGDLTISNRLGALIPNSAPVPIDVTTFVRSQVAAGARYVGFSVWNVATEGSLRFYTPSGLVTYIEVPWDLPFSDVPRVVVEIRPPEPWVSPLPDVPRRVQLTGDGVCIQRVQTLHAVSEMYGVDINRDSFFEYFFAPGAESGPGIKVNAEEALRVGPRHEWVGSRRCAVVFDLGGIATNVLFRMVSAQLTLETIGLGKEGLAVRGRSYELHGFASGPTVAVDDLNISNRLFGPVSYYLPFPIDVTAFVMSKVAAGARYVGFSVWNVATDGGALSFITRSEIPWADGSRLAITLPWDLPLADVPGLVVELRAPEPWALPRSDVPRLVVEMLFGAIHRRWQGHSPASPILPILDAVLISEIAASMTEAGARAIQKQALEMISRIAADEIGRLSREE